MRETTKTWALGHHLALSYSPTQRVHIQLTALIYRLTGPRPIAAKLVNALAAALGVAAFGLLSARIFGPPVGLASAALLGFWPSHVFYTSQNFKEGLVGGALMGALFFLTPQEGPHHRLRGIEAAAGLSLLVLLGFFRSYVMMAAAVALSAAAAAALLRCRGTRSATALTLAACLAAPLVYKVVMNTLLDGPLKASVDGPTSESLLIPTITDAGIGEAYRPLSPRGIT